MHGDRLDYPSHRSQRKAQWTQLVYRDNVPLLRPEWEGSGVFLPVRVCVRRYALVSHSSFSNAYHRAGMCAFGIIIGEYLNPPACHPLTVPKATQYRTSYAPYSPPSQRYPSSPFSPSANSSSRSAPSASRTRSPCTGRSTSSLARPSSR